MLNKKPTKFICLIHFLCEDAYIRDESGSLILIPRNMIVNDEDGEISVAECRHEDFDDNLVQTYYHNGMSADEMLVDIHGRYWYILDHMTKEDTINAFE